MPDWNMTDISAQNIGQICIRQSSLLHRMPPNTGFGDVVLPVANIFHGFTVLAPGRRECGIATSFFRQNK